MKKYLLHGNLKAISGKQDELVAILSEAATLVQSAKGCQSYVVSVDPDDNRAVWITEVWDSKEDHDNSLSFPGVRELIGKAMRILDGAPQKGQELTVVGGC